METESGEKIKYLVADTTAFINTVPLNQYAMNVLTVPDVVAEVRNKRQIRRLCVLPFDLQVREPKAECVKHCVEFAKKTGDYASLSGIDIKVVALTYELELEHVGSAHLRNEPVMSQVISSRNKPEELQDNTKLAGWYNPADGEESDDEEEDEDDDENENGSEEEEEKEDEDDGVDKVKAAIELQLAGGDDEPYNDQDEVTDEMLEHIFEKMKCTTDDAADELLVPEGKLNENSENGIEEAPTENDTNSPADADDDGDWITPTNIKKVKKTFDGRLEQEAIPVVGCMSTDYAVQNVIKQMNLNLTALDGRVIKQLRTYILRCYACYNTTSVMTKIFCPKCGNKTLKRVAVSLDENGKQVIHINTRRPLTAKYKNQSLPRFRGGKHSHNPILFEDQPIPRQMPSRVAKTKTNALDVDYTAGFSPFMKRDVDSKSAMLRSKGHLKEWARNNAYEEGRRMKHNNRLYKSNA